MGKIIDYLQDVHNIPMEQLCKDLQKIGFELIYENADQNVYKFGHIRNDLIGSGEVKANLKSCKYMVEIHCDEVSGPHMHITDNLGNLYDKDMNNLTAKHSEENPEWHKTKVINFVKRLPAAHIKIKEFVKIKGKPKNV